jgi:uncharacterized protein involved in exopolysaccharide biosynthesis
VIPGKQYTPDLIVQIAWRRKWWIVIPAIAIITGVFVVTRQLTDVYKSDTQIQIVPPRVPQSLVQSSRGSGAGSTGQTAIEARVKTISQQVLSRSHLEKVIEDFGLYREARKTGIMEDVVEAMRADVEGPTIKGSTFTLAFMHENPRTAMRVAERLASMFIDESLRDRETLAEGTSQFLEAQVEDARRQLVDNERRLQDYGRLHNGELPAQLEANLQGIHNTEMQLQSLEQSVNSDRDRHLLLERMVADAQAGVDVPARQLQRVEATNASTENIDLLEQLTAPRMVPMMLGRDGGGGGGKGGGGGGGGGGKGGGDTSGGGTNRGAGFNGGGGGGGGGKGGASGGDGGKGGASAADGKAAGAPPQKGGDDTNAGKDRASDDAGKGAQARPGSRPATAIEQLRAAQATLRGLELRLTPEHPDVIRARRAVAELQQRADADAAERGLDSDDPLEAARRNKMTEMTTELARLDKQIVDKTTAQAHLRELQQNYQRRIEATPSRETELTELTRDYGTLRASYTSLLQRRLDAQVAANLERRQIGETFKLVDAARLPTKPYSPNRPRIYLIGIGSAIGFGLLLAGLLEYFDRAMRSEDDVRAALNLQVLATVPMIRISSRRSRRDVRRELPGAAAMLALGIDLLSRVLR